MIHSTNKKYLYDIRITIREERGVRMHSESIGGGVVEVPNKEDAIAAAISKFSNFHGETNV